VERRGEGIGAPLTLGYTRTFERLASRLLALEGGGIAMGSRTTAFGVGVMVTAFSAMVWTTAVHGQAAGKIDAAQLYKENCQACHQDGNSQIMPNMSFADGVWVHGSSVKEVANTIANGSSTNPAMMPFKERLTPEQIEALAKFVRQFDKKLAGPAKSAKPAAKKP
jgi:mono/diheme cytochrome c family protein